MGTNFLIGGVDEFDTLFEPYTTPYLTGSKTDYQINGNDLRNRYLRFSSLQSFLVNTSGGTQLSVATQESTTTDYEVVNADLKTIFAQKGSVKYGIVIPITANQLNLDLLSYATNYLQVNFSSIYDSNFSFFNSNYNAGAGFSASNPSIIFYIESGVVIYSNNNTLPALTADSFPSGVFVKILNYGHIAGAAGPNGLSTGGSSPGGNGGTGGTAITLSSNVTIDNTNGYIYGGGGGGGAGGPAICQGYSADIGNYISTYTGGAGGNGAGSNGGVITAATNGVLGKGPMGAINPCNTNNVTGWYADWGGDGGTWGTAGGNGYSTVSPYHTANWYPDGTGGGAGLAIITNGYTITWQGGSSSPHVLGSVI